MNGICPPRPTKPDPPGTVTRAALRAELIEAGELVPVRVEGVRGTRYVLAVETELLAEAAASAAEGEPLEGASAVLLAPLDPLAWDRQLLRELFDFDYVWEVYVPRAKRRWGYYVLPLLWGDRFVGRIEPRIERKEGAVRIVGIWWQEGFRPRREEDFVEGLRSALAAYLRFGGAARLEWGAHGPEKRLIGVRPTS